MKGAAAAFQAIKLDTTMSETYAALGGAYLLSLWKFDEAEKNFKKAIDINPNLAWTHFFYSWTLYLVGRKDEALVQHELAKKYDPFDQDISAQLSDMYTLDGYYEKAITEALNSLEISRDNRQGLWALGDAYRESGRINEAIETHKKLAEKYPSWMWMLGYTYAVTGKKDEAEKILAEMNKLKVNSWVAYGLIALNAALNKKDEAFKWLVYEPHHEWLPWVAVLPWFKNLHGDPRFDEFVKKLNLPKK